MSILTLAGDLESALTHFCGLGLAMIVSEESGQNAYLRWDSANSPRLQVQIPGLDELDMAQAIQSHARRHGEPVSWVQTRIEHENRANVGLFSPRIKTPSSPSSWIALTGQRDAVIADLESSGSYLDLMFIQGLGQPGYWCVDDKEYRPDRAASRWEMKARNRGEEFIGNRLSAMASALSDRGPELTLSGLRGESVIDDLGSGADSQTATGLQLPGEVDTARAWCAMWAMAAFPVIHNAHGPSITPCAFPPRALHTKHMVLPIFRSWVSPPKYRDTVLSKQFFDHASNLSGVELEEANLVASRTWLAEIGIVATMRFAVQKTEGNAPQRFVLDGEVIPLEETWA